MKNSALKCLRPIMPSDRTSWRVPVRSEALNPFGTPSTLISLPVVRPHFRVEGISLQSTGTRTISLCRSWLQPQRNEALVRLTDERKRQDNWLRARGYCL